MPGTVPAQPRRLIGGNVIGIIAGIACYYAFMNPALMPYYEEYSLLHWLPAAVSVGLAIFMMTVFNAEHPPSAAISLGLVVEPWDYRTIIFIILYAILLAVVRVVFRKYLKDLYT